MNLYKKVLKKISLIILFVFFTINSHSIEPKVFIQSVADSATSILSEKISIEKKTEKLMSLAKKSVDIKGIGFYTLGSNRKNLKNEEKKKYNLLFEKYFLKKFSSTLTSYTEPKIVVLSADIKSEKYTIVNSRLLATDKRPEIKINWRVYTKNPHEPLIRDLIIEGVSLARAQKEEFQSIIQSNDGNINALFSSLESFINK